MSGRISFVLRGLIVLNNDDFVDTATLQVDVDI
jgi:hypothetical protein